jgi:hypothetical protein
MEQHEFDSLIAIEQDPSFPRVVLKSEPLPSRFRVMPPPTASEALYSEVMGESLSAFEKNVAVAQHRTATLQVAEVLSTATDFDELEKAARANGTSTTEEMLSILRKAAADSLKPTPAALPTQPGHIPTARPQTTPSSRSPKSAARRKKLRELFVASGIPITAYNDQAVESLITAMESYLDNQVE